MEGVTKREGGESWRRGRISMNGVYLGRLCTQERGVPRKGITQEMELLGKGSTVPSNFGRRVLIYGSIPFHAARAFKNQVLAIFNKGGRKKTLLFRRYVPFQGGWSTQLPLKKWNLFRQNVKNTQ